MIKFGGIILVLVYYLLDAAGINRKKSHKRMKSKKNEIDIILPRKCWCVKRAFSRTKRRFLVDFKWGKVFYCFFIYPRNKLLLDVNISTLKSAPKHFVFYPIFFIQRFFICFSFRNRPAQTTIICFLFVNWEFFFIYFFAMITNIRHIFQPKVQNFWFFNTIFKPFLKTQANHLVS